ncbi:unnamed protein product [Lymnaea stagnalis]|uniref:Uncharacterized protein n=1 Tax=Lymnaea stagnalis TaxID=6523 RepID=A0AAV2IFQ2_LYMST
MHSCSRSLILRKPHSMPTPQMTSCVAMRLLLVTALLFAVIHEQKAATYEHNECKHVVEIARLCDQCTLRLASVNFRTFFDCCMDVYGMRIYCQTVIRFD